MFVSKFKSKKCYLPTLEAFLNGLDRRSVIRYGWTMSCVVVGRIQDESTAAVGRQ